MEHRWANSSFFRFAAVMPLAIACLITLLLMPMYYEATEDIKQSVDESIQLEIVNLETQYGILGIPGLAEQIAHRMEWVSNPGMIYLLLDQQGNKIIGNLSEWPGQITDDDQFEIREPDGKLLMGSAIMLSDGERLLVARRSPLERFRSHMGQQLLVGGIAITLLSALIAWAFVRSIHLRLAELAHSADMVRQGALSQRLPISSRNDELDGLSLRFNEAFARIELLMDASRAVSSAIAHDMRHPLGRLRNSIEQIRQQAHGNEVQEQQMDALLEQIDNVLRSFSAMLRLARLESGSFDAERRRVDLQAVVEDVGDLYEPVAEEQGRSLRYELDAAIILGDRELLFQALSNLVENALKYGDGEIVITMRRHYRESIVISVRDHGSGVTAEALPRLFERFYRADTSRSNVDGTGIGLALVEAIVEYHSGKVVAYNASPGLDVIITLPLEHTLM